MEPFINSGTPTPGMWEMAEQENGEVIINCEGVLLATLPAGRDALANARIMRAAKDLFLSVRECSGAAEGLCKIILQADQAALLDRLDATYAGLGKRADKAMESAVPGSTIGARRCA